MRQEVRIIGGAYRGKKLQFPALPGLRPTADRVKETLFNWLMQEIRGARCLDAFAGSGALGFEAMSRGASEVVLLEEAPSIYANLKTLASGFKDEAIALVCTNAVHYLRLPNPPFDIIFLDPPFNSSYLQECLTILEEGKALVKGGLIYAESSKPLSTLQSSFTIFKEKRAGQVYYGLLKA